MGGEGEEEDGWGSSSHSPKERLANKDDDRQHPHRLVHVPPSPPHVLHSTLLFCIFVSFVSLTFIAILFA